MTQAALAVVFAALVAAVAYRARALTMRGAFAAFVVGAIVFGAGGWRARRKLPAAIFSARWRRPNFAAGL